MIAEKDLVWSSPNDPKPGSRWVHENGTVYVVDGFSLNALQANVRLIRYYAASGDPKRTWDRPLDMFLNRFTPFEGPIERPSFDRLYLDFARQISRRSKCERLSVGCLISSEDHSEVFSVGYNGGPRQSKRQCRGAAAQGNCGCMHAESNAIAKCRAARGERKIVYVTHQPCELCATALVNMGGVIRVRWSEAYRIYDGVDILQEAGIETPDACPISERARDGE